MTEFVTWASAGGLLLILCIVAVYAAWQRPIHKGDRLDRLLRDVSTRNRACPGPGMSRTNDATSDRETQ